MSHCDSISKLLLWHPGSKGFKELFFRELVCVQTHCMGSLDCYCEGNVSHNLAFAKGWTFRIWSSRLAEIAFSKHWLAVVKNTGFHQRSRRSSLLSNETPSLPALCPIGALTNRQRGFQPDRRSVLKLHFQNVFSTRRLHRFSKEETLISYSSESSTLRWMCLIFRFVNW